MVPCRSAFLGTLFGILFLCANAVQPSRCSAEPREPTRKKIIEFGWDSPDPEYMRHHIREMEQQPFDGTVFQLRYTKMSGEKLFGNEGSFLSEAWGKRRFEPIELAAAERDLRATSIQRFSDNFARLNVTPGDVDWFDDFSPIIDNVRLLARAARAGRAKGILLDVEHYAALVFDYRTQPHVRAHTFEEYAQQAELRGAQIMEAMQAEFPDITVFLTYGYSLPWRRCEGNIWKLWRTEYGLLPGFLNGMLSAAKGKTRFVEGYEFSYRFEHASEFEEGLTEIRRGVLPLVKNHAAYDERFSAAFGIWLDAPNSGGAWSHLQLDSNLFTPGKFAKSIRLALAATDEYVWIYNQKPHWWKVEAPDQVVPEPYRTALAAHR